MAPVLSPKIDAARAGVGSYTAAVKTRTVYGFASVRIGIIELLVVFLALCGAHSRAQVPLPAAEEFFNVIKANDTNRVAQLLAGNTNLVHANYYGRLPLHVAASEGRGLSEVTFVRRARATKRHSSDAERHNSALCYRRRCLITLER